jgi:hypothetical protein
MNRAEKTKEQGILQGISSGPPEKCQNSAQNPQILEKNRELAGNLQKIR